MCNGICHEEPLKTGKYLGTGIGIVLTLLGRRALTGNPSCQGEARAQARSCVVWKKTNLPPSIYTIQH